MVRKQGDTVLSRAPGDERGRNIKSIEAGSGCRCTMNMTMIGKDSPGRVTGPKGVDEGGRDDGRESGGRSIRHSPAGPKTVQGGRLDEVEVPAPEHVNRGGAVLGVGQGL